MELHWGLPVIGYLFLAGVGAGAYVISGWILLRGERSWFAGEHHEIARLGALIAPLPMILGTGLIIFELGTFQAGVQQMDVAKLFKWINLFLTVNASPMNIGSWVLGLCIVASVLYAWTFLKPGAGGGDGAPAGLQRLMAWVGIPLGIAVALYTGIMLGAAPARPFWNSQILGLLFLLSALSTGIAGILLCYALFRKGRHDAPSGDHAGFVLAFSDAVLIAMELVVIFFFILFAHLTVGDPAHAIDVILPGGSLALWFWVGVVLFGMVVPALVEVHHVAPRLARGRPYLIQRPIEIGIGALILGGGFLLRYVIVVAGQITGPVGL